MDLEGLCYNSLDVAVGVDEKCLMAYKVAVHHKIANVRLAGTVVVARSEVRCMMCYECALKRISKKHLELRSILT